MTLPDVTGYTLDSTAGAWPQQVKFTVLEHLFTHSCFPSVKQWKLRVFPWTFWLFSWKLRLFTWKLKLFVKIRTLRHRSINQCGDIEFKMITLNCEYIIVCIIIFILTLLHVYIVYIYLILMFTYFICIWGLKTIGSFKTIEKKAWLYSITFTSDLKVDIFEKSRDF